VSDARNGSSGARLVPWLRVHHLARALARGAARRGTDRSARGHADRTTSGPESCPCDGTTACTDASRQVMVCKIVASLRIRDLGGTFASETTNHGANRRAGRHPDRPTDGPERCAGCSAAACAHALGEVVIGEIVPAFGVHHFSCAFACQTTRDAADGGTCGHAHGTGNSADAGAGDGARCGASAGAEHVLALMLLPARSK